MSSFIQFVSHLENKTNRLLNWTG